MLPQSSRCNQLRDQADLLREWANLARRANAGFNQDEAQENPVTIQPIENHSSLDDRLLLDHLVENISNHRIEVFSHFLFFLDYS